MNLEDFSYDSEYYKFRYTDGILFGTYIGGPITLEIVKDLVKKRLELTKGEDVLIIVEVDRSKSIDRDARVFLSTDEGTKGLKAGAIVTDSPFTKHMANFFLKISFSKAKLPARVFSTKEEAVEWLRQYE